MRARSTAVLLCAAVGLLGAYMLVRAVDLASTGKPTGIALALGVVLLVAGEVRFGLGSERLGRRLGAEGGLADSSALERTPSGRVSRDAADALFTERKAEVEAAPEDWRAWFRLATAYGDARDTPRGRRAMRTAIRLERASAGP